MTLSTREAIHGASLSDVAVNYTLQVTVAQDGANQSKRQGFPDPDDRTTLAVGIVGEVGLVVSGDSDMLALAVEGVPVRNVREAPGIAPGVEANDDAQQARVG